MSLNQEIHRNTLKKYNKIERDLLKIMQKAQRSNEYTVKKISAVVKENRSFEFELINMTKIVEKLKEKCMSLDAKQKVLNDINHSKKRVTNGMKLQTSEDNWTNTKKHNKTRKVAKSDQETNLSYSQKSINIKDSDSNNFITNVSSKVIKNTTKKGNYYRDDISKEIEEKEKQVYNAINWAYEKMKLYEYNIRKPDFLEEKGQQKKWEEVLVEDEGFVTQDEINTDNKNVPKEEQKNLKGVFLDQLKSMHQNLRGELEELHNGQDYALSINCKDDQKDYYVEDEDTQIEVFSKLMEEILSQLNCMYYTITRERENCNDQNNIIQKEKISTNTTGIIQIKYKKELLYKLKNTCDVMKKLCLSITEKLIDENVEAVFKNGVEDTKIEETNKTIQHVLDRITSIQENPNLKHEFSVNEDVVEVNNINNNMLDQTKETHENLKNAYDSTIEEFKDKENENINKNDKSQTIGYKNLENKCTVLKNTTKNVKAELTGTKPSKIPKYNNLSKNLPNNFQTINGNENLTVKDSGKNLMETTFSSKKLTEEDGKMSNANSKQSILKQLNSTYQNMTSEYKLIRQKLMENKLSDRIKEVSKSGQESIDINKTKPKENEINKSKITVKDILKQLKKSYETLKQEYDDVVEDLNNEIEEEESLLLRLERVKQNKQKILNRLKSVNRSVRKDDNQLFNKKYNSILNESKNQQIKDVQKTKLKDCISKDTNMSRFHYHKKIKRSRRLDAKLKLLHMKDVYTQNNLIEHICGRFIIKHKHFIRCKRQKTKNIRGKKNNINIDQTKRDNNNLKNEQSCSKTTESKDEFVKRCSTYENVKEEYVHLTTDIQNLTKKINQIGDIINNLEKNIKEEKREFGGFKELKLIYIDLKEKSNDCIIEIDIFNKEITALEYEKMKIEQDMTSLDTKIGKFKGKKSEFESKILLTDLETAYEELKQDFDRRITNKQKELQEKISKFLNNLKNIEQIVKLLEKRVKEYENGLKKNVNDAVKELIINYNTLKKEYNQIITEKKMSIKEELTRLINDRRKIEKEMSNIELKLKTFKIDNEKSHEIVQLKKAYENIKRDYEDHVSRRNKDVESKNDSFKVYKIKTEEDINILETKLKELNLDQNNVIMFNEIDRKKLDTLKRRSNNFIYYYEPLTSIKESSLEDIMLSKKKDKITVDLDETTTFYKDNISIQTEEINTKSQHLFSTNSKNKCMFTQTYEIEEHTEYVKNDKIIRKAEKLTRLDKELTEDTVKKNKDVIKMAEEQLDRIGRYLTACNSYEATKKVFGKELELELNDKKVNNVLENNFDLKEIILLHENMCKQELQQKIKDIRQLKSSWKERKNGKHCVREIKGQESGDKFIDYREKLRLVKLPNQSLYDYQTIVHNELKSDQEVESMVNVTPNKTKDYIKHQNENNCFNLKMILNTEKENFKELKDILIEKSDILENINNALKGLLENSTDSKPKRNRYTKQENETILNVADTTTNAKQRSLKIVRLPSQHIYQFENSEPETLNQETKRIKYIDDNDNKQIFMPNEFVIPNQFDNLFKEDTIKHNQVIFKEEQNIKHTVQPNYLRAFENELKGKIDDKTHLSNLYPIKNEEIMVDGKGWFEMSITENSTTKKKNNLVINETENNLKNLEQFNKMYLSKEDHEQISNLKHNGKQMSSINFEDGSIEFTNIDKSKNRLHEENDSLKKLLEEKQKLFWNSLNFVSEMLEDKNGDIKEFEVDVNTVKPRKISSTVFIEPSFNKHQIKVNNHHIPDLADTEKNDEITRISKTLDSEPFQLKANVISKDEVESMIWDTVLGQDFDISNLGQDTLSSRSVEIVMNELFLEQKTSFDAELNVSISSVKLDKQEELDTKKGKHVCFVDKPAEILNDEEETTKKGVWK